MYEMELHFENIIEFIVIPFYFHHYTESCFYSKATFFKNDDFYNKYLLIINEFIPLLV